MFYKRFNDRPVVPNPICGTYNPKSGVSDQQWEQFDNDGYIIIRGIFTAEELDARKQVRIYFLKNIYKNIVRLG